MTRITNADQVLLLLRSHLQRSERSQRKSAAGTKAGRKKVRQTPLERVQGIAHSEELSGEELERALIAGIFNEEFGAAAANDAKFQLMVDDVLAMIRRDAAGRKLLDKAVAQLIGSRQ